MKQFLYLLLISSPLFFSSCNDDPEGGGPGVESCDTLSDDILHGLWNVNGLPTSGQITMIPDGTLIDDDHVLILYSMGGLEANVKSWNRVDNEVFFNAAFDDEPGSDTQSVSATISEFDCDQITFSSLIGFTFTR